MGLDEAFARFPVLETERLLLRELREEDGPAIYDVFRDPVVTRYYGFSHLTRPEQGLALVRDRLREWTERTAIRWGLELRETGALVGTVGYLGIDAKNAFCELGYDLHRDHWGRGLSTEAVRAILPFAFETLGMNRVEALSDPRNVASRRLLERLGFREEGTLRARFVHEGEIQDDIMYSRLAWDEVPG